MQFPDGAEFIAHGATCVECQLDCEMCQLSETGHEAREEGSLIHLMEYALFAGNPPYSNLPYSFVSVTVAQLCRGMMGRPLR
jgi:hypothetical protein